MRSIQLPFVVLLALVAWLPVRALAAQGASVHAILITATNQKAPADPKLAPYEAELQRNLPLSSFRYIGEGSAQIAQGARGAISLGRGHRLELEGEKAAGGIKLKVLWKNGGNVVMDTTLTLQPGSPVVLGRRPGDDGETPIVLVIAR